MDTRKALAGGAHASDARRDEHEPPRFDATVRGLLAVAGLLLSAVRELVSAWLGVPRLQPYTRHVRRTFAEAYYDGVHGIKPAEVVGDDDVIGDD